MSGNKRKQFSLWQKVLILKEIDKGKKQSVIAKELGLAATTVSTIIKDREKIIRLFERSSLSGRKRLRLGDHQEIEDAVHEWYKSIRDAGIAINGCMLKAKAREIAKTMRIETFEASAGWLYRFRDRYGISWKNSEERTLGIWDSNVMHPMSFVDATIHDTNKAYNQKNNNAQYNLPEIELSIVKQEPNEENKNIDNGQNNKDKYINNEENDEIKLEPLAHNELIIEEGRIWINDQLVADTKQNLPAAIYNHSGADEDSASREHNCVVDDHNDREHKLSVREHNVLAKELNLAAIESALLIREQKLQAKEQKATSFETLVPGRENDHSMQEKKLRRKERRIAIIYKQKKLEFAILKNQRKEKEHLLRVLAREKKIEFYNLENERRAKEHATKMDQLNSANYEVLHL